MPIRDGEGCDLLRWFHCKFYGWKLGNLFQYLCSSFSFSLIHRSLAACVGWYLHVIVSAQPSVFVLDFVSSNLLPGSAMEYPEQLLLKHTISIIDPKENQGTSYKNRKEKTVCWWTIIIIYKCRCRCGFALSRDACRRSKNPGISEEVLFQFWSERIFGYKSRNSNDKPFLCSQPSFLIEEEDN